MTVIMAPGVIRKKVFIRLLGVLAVACSVSLFTWTLTHERVHTDSELSRELLAKEGSRLHSSFDVTRASEDQAVISETALRRNFHPSATPRSSSSHTVQQQDGQLSRSSLIQTAGFADMKTSIKRLIIVGQPRTGSSFLGDAFNQHPDVFYLFEPLYGVAPPKQPNDPRPMKFLEGMLRCKFEFPQYIQEIEKFRRISSRALSSPPLCAAKSQDLDKKKLQCVHLNPYNMESVCRNHSKTVLKILTPRIPSYRVDSLFPLCNSSDCGIIYLVRDPRSLVFSHMKVGFAWATRKTNTLSPQPIVRRYSKTICQQVEENVRIFQDRPRWMKHRSFMLRYEDLARNPVKILRRVYKMAGLHMQKSSLEWIQAHTGKGATNEKEEKNHFSTNRNSEVVVDKWRIDMDPCIVNIIEESCHSLMRRLGYKPVNGSNKTQYDLAVSLSDG